MSNPLSSNPYAVVQRYLRRINRQEELDNTLILHYNTIVRDLRPWFW
jgi:hypothetical protein